MISEALPSRLRVAVVGVGGVGGYFGGRLAQAGHEVTFVARGATLAALQTQGLRVFSALGDFTVQPARATDDPGHVGEVDAVLVAVKAGQIPHVAHTLNPLLGPGTAVLPMQNGVEAADQLAAALGEAFVLGGLCRIISAIEAPGVIRHSGGHPSVTFGEFSGQRSDRVQRLQQAFEAAGVTVDLPTDIRVAIWEKALFVSSLGAVAAVARATIGELRALPETRALIERAMQEVATVAHARGVPLPGNAVAAALAFVDALPAAGTTSLQRDIEAGRPSELDAQLGAIVRLGREAGVPTPVYDFAWRCLLPQERRAQPLSG
ncbi:2-dehydropantoate 2-reductase [Deinococcus aquaedulcis]|uniref:2-dehydropantoate 2-reductase n=1 Tax=Deinococcus aquaedulcis TaxID=2840455 RepID=UPI001C83B675|nr:2-dehydropantoate 2-reductase [Deinococcus aquaedulcis]